MNGTRELLNGALQLFSGGADEQAPANPTDFVSVIDIFCFGRKFLRSNRGYFGLVPTLTKSGDYLAVFPGVAVLCPTTGYLGLQSEWALLYSGH